MHTIYEIAETWMVWLYNYSPGTDWSDEKRYVKLFKSFSLNSNFYFSYTYNLIHTLQENILKKVKLA